MQTFLILSHEYRKKNGKKNVIFLHIFLIKYVEDESIQKFLITWRFMIFHRKLLLKECKYINRYTTNVLKENYPLIVNIKRHVNAHVS